ncbi:MAG: DUF3526 domain-containing protein [Cytophagaceae bacterium]
MMRLIFTYEWISFKRNSFHGIMLFILAIFSVYAILYGKAVTDKQNEVLRQIENSRQEEYKAYKAGFTADTTITEGLQAYQKSSNPAFAWRRHSFVAAIEPKPLASLSVGQRDLQPYFYRLTGMSLYYQLFQNEIENPLKLLSGNFDLPFVIIYIFPLLIIAFTYIILASEKELGILPLLRIQSKMTLKRLAMLKLFFYACLITALALSFSILGFIISGLPDLTSMFQWCMTVFAYISFWLALMFLIISFRKSTIFNAIAGLSTWLLFLVIAPALLNISLSLNHTVDDTQLAGTVRRLALENEQDEQEAISVIHEYLQKKPSLKVEEVSLKKNLIAKAYASFGQLNDMKHKEMADAYENKIKLRNELAQNFDFINPSVSAMNTFSMIARTDFHTYTNFRKSLMPFHQKIVDFYHEKLFYNKTIEESDYAALPQFSLHENFDHNMAIYKNIAILLLTALIIFMTGLWTSKRE